MPARSMIGVGLDRSRPLACAHRWITFCERSVGTPVVVSCVGAQAVDNFDDCAVGDCFAFGKVPPGVKCADRQICVLEDRLSASRVATSVVAQGRTMLDVEVDSSAHSLHEIGGSICRGAGCAGSCGTATRSSASRAAMATTRLLILSGVNGAVTRSPGPASRIGPPGLVPRAECYRSAESGCHCPALLATLLCVVKLLLPVFRAGQ